MEKRKGDLLSPELKERAKTEFRKFLLYFIYLAAFFCSFIFYRNLIVEQYAESYIKYGLGIVEALVIAKLILIGQMLHLGEKKFEKSPLIIPAIYKTVVFSLFILLFGVFEHYTIGFIKGMSAAEVTHSFLAEGIDEILSRTLVKFLALIPFFAILEIESVLGEDKIYQLYFKKRK